jgi:hypothetical protein
MACPSALQDQAKAKNTVAQINSTPASALEIIFTYHIWCMALALIDVGPHFPPQFCRPRKSRSPWKKKGSGLHWCTSPGYLRSASFNEWRTAEAVQLESIAVDNTIQCNAIALLQLLWSQSNFSNSRKPYIQNACTVATKILSSAVATKIVSASTVNRTLGLQIFSLALSQLSYRGELDMSE